nr:hypothetical protein [Janibacter melonis]
MRDPQDVVICAPYRTAVGAFGGSMQPLLPAQIGTQLMTGLVERTGIDPAAVEDVILGHCYANGEARPSAGSSRWMPVCRSRRPGCSSTAAAARVCRRSSRA